MQARAIEIIQDEHRALSAMLTSMRMLIAQDGRSDAQPHFDVLRAMLLYIDEFPERLHHRKESSLLFPKVRERAPQVAAALDKLDREHAIGERQIRELEHLLLAWEVMGDSRRELFVQALDSYITFYRAHMTAEETEILPAARAHLTAEDWADVDAAFLDNRDPLCGHEAAADYQPLFTKIVNSAPAPIGLG